MLALEHTADSTFDRVACDLTHQAFPEQAAALRARCDRILKHWRRLSLMAMPHLDAFTLEEFEDTIGTILSAAADAIQSADPRQLRGVIESGPQHGIDRFVQKYSLLDLFEEVRILRGVVILELAEEMRRPLEPDEAATFHAIFDIIIQQGVMALVQRQDEEQRQTQDIMRQMNERLLVATTEQHELTEQARRAERALRESEAELETELSATRTLQELSIELIRVDAPELLYEKVLDAGVSIMGSDFASMQMLEPKEAAPGNGAELRLLTFRGFSPQAAKLWERVRQTATTTCGRALATGRRCMVSDIEKCEWMAGSESQAMYRQLGIRSVQSTPLLSRGGQLIGMISTHWSRPHVPAESNLHRFDILARQAAELIERKLVEEVRARLAAIVASSDDAIISKDLTGIITTWNRGAQQLFGYTAEEMIGKSVALLIPEAHLDEEPKILERIGRGESIEHYETVRRRKDGTLLNISLTVSPIRDAAGRVIGASKIARDITDRVEMENRIKHQAETLAGESRRKDEFLAMLSHELRNPLAPIRSALHLMHLQERPGAENLLQKQAREIIERQVGNLTKLVRDLLDVSRVASGRIRLERQTIDLNQVVQHAIETVAPMIEQRKHKLLPYLSPEPVWCDADPTRMEEVFINLLNNAAKYTPDGGRIEVWCERHQEANEAQVRVRDDGVGIDPELLPRVFDLFTQADRSLSRSAGGLGIGLSLAHRLVALHGGSIEAHSPPQGRHAGSEFIVRLALTAEPQRSVAHAPASPGPPNPEGVRVLVVDDNLDSAMVLAALLRQWGYSVQTAYTGPEGLKAAMQWRPEIVLMDIGLPGLDGYEVARRLRSDATLRKAGLPIKLIALTGYGRDADVARAHEAGFHAHLVKPCDLDELQELLAVSNASR